MCSLGRGMQISVQFLSPRLFLSSWEKRFCSSFGPVRCNPRSPAKKKALKFQSLDSCNDSICRVAERGRIAVKSLDRISSAMAAPDEEGFEYEASHDTSGDFFEFKDAINLQLASADDNNTKHDGDKVKEDARNMAIGFLAARAITVAELRKKLSGQKYACKVIDSVIADLQNRGLVNDCSYAESFSRSRWLANTWGPRRIKKALLDKGVSKEDADKATTQVFEEQDPSGSGQRGLPGISQLSLDHLFTQASKQWLRYQNKSPEKRKSGIIRWLQYRGFDWLTIKVILKKLQCEYPP